MSGIGRYVVHEFLCPGQQATSFTELDKHPDETRGRDIAPDADGLYRAFEAGDGIVVDAAPILHRSAFHVSTSLPS